VDNVTLTSKQFALQLKLFAGLVIVIATIALLCTESADSFWAQLQRALSMAIVASSFAFAGLYEWGWRWGPLPKWLGRPVIQGVWLGHIASDYGRKADEPRRQIPIVFVVRQTFLTLSIQSFTQGQTGLSKVEALLIDEGTDSVQLAYVYELQRKYEGTTSLVDGAGILTLNSDQNRLKGSYWASSPSHGTLAVKRVANKTKIIKQIKEFADAKKRWPSESLWASVPQ